MYNNGELGFRISSKRIFLTYHGSPSVYDVLYGLQAKLQATHNIQEYLIATEKNETNSEKHIHAYIQLEKILDTRNARFLDLTIKGMSYHPHIKKVYADKNADILNTWGVEAVLNYILKEIYNKESAEDLGHYIASTGIKQRIGRYGNLISEEAGAIGLAEKGNIDGALNILKEKNPLEYIIRYKDYKENFQRMALDSDTQISYFTKAIQMAKSGNVENAIRLLEEKEPESYLKNAKEFKAALFNIGQDAQEHAYDAECFAELTQLFDVDSYDTIAKFASAIKDSNQVLPIISMTDFKKMPFLNPTIELLRRSSIQVVSIAHIEDFKNSKIHNEMYAALLIVAPSVSMLIGERHSIIDEVAKMATASWLHGTETSKLGIVFYSDSKEVMRTVRSLFKSKLRSCTTSCIDLSRIEILKLRRQIGQTFRQTRSLGKATDSK